MGSGREEAVINTGVKKTQVEVMSPIVRQEVNVQMKQEMTG